MFTIYYELPEEIVLAALVPLATHVGTYSVVCNEVSQGPKSKNALRVIKTTDVSNAAASSMLLPKVYELEPLLKSARFLHMESRGNGAVSFAFEAEEHIALVWEGTKRK